MFWRGARAWGSTLDEQITTAAANALESGHLVRADDFLEQLQQLYSGPGSELQRANTAEQRGHLAIAQLRYQDAARHFSEAGRWLEEAVTAFRASQEEYTRERWPRVWTAIQHDLATALRTEFVADSPLEGAEFEPSVPLVRPVPEWLENGARALCAWSAEMRAHP